MAAIWNSARRHLRLGLARAAARRASAPAAAFVSGSGDGNLGDELMLEATRRVLQGVTLVPVDHPATERRLGAVGLSGAGVFDGLVLGGGTLVNPHFERLVSGVFGDGLPAWTLGTGVGSSGFGMSPEVDVAPWAELLGGFEGVWVRGPLSAERLDALGVDGVRVCGDLALALTPPRPLPARDEGALAVNVGASRVRFGGDGGIEPAAALAAALRPLRDEGRRVIPFAMHRDDAPALDAFRRGLGEPKAEILTPASLDSLWSLLEGVDAVVGVRLHAGVMSWAAGVPALMVAYRDKCLDFARHLGVEDAVVGPGAGPRDIEAKVRGLLAEGRGRGALVHGEAVGARRAIEAAAAQIREGVAAR
ncbi:MAG TPA: polysaccharide pyruvyl transferase family protein [Solirubrobacterales bacterium]|nr:polysaccharide pyruvyl transferase family protein [Solirubrobacterales bacterium]